MNGTQTPDYSGLIRKIKIKRMFTFIAYIAAIVCVIIFTDTYDSIIIPLIFIALAFFAFAFLFSLASLPVFNSMEAECEPYKHLVLNQTFNKKNKVILYSAYALDLFYLGRYAEAIGYANSLMTLRKPSAVTVGLFHRAKCEYMLGYYDALKMTAEQFDRSLAALTKSKDRDMAVKMRTVIALMCALTGNDVKVIEKYNLELTEYNRAKHTEGFNHYLHGVAAQRLDRETECAYHLISAKEICKSTVIPQYCDEILNNLSKA